MAVNIFSHQHYDVMPRPRNFETPRFFLK